MTWEPIKDAPQDGSPVVVYEPPTPEEFEMYRLAFWKRDSLVYQDDDHMSVSERATHFCWLERP